MYYLINSISGIFVTTMDKDEILSKIQEIESQDLVNSYGNIMQDTQLRLQFINDVQSFLDVTFTKELYHVEHWKQRIRQSLQNEDESFCYSWTLFIASVVLVKIKQLLINDNVIAYDLLTTCYDMKVVPVPHHINTEKKQRTTAERIIEHSATAILYGQKAWHAKDTYGFYNKMICTLEYEQFFLHRQLTPFESKLLVWARTEREHANEAMIKEGCKTAVHTLSSIGEIIEYGVAHQKNKEFTQYIV